MRIVTTAPFATELFGWPLPDPQISIIVKAAFEPAASGMTLCAATGLFPYDRVPTKSQPEIVLLRAAAKARQCQPIAVLEPGTTIPLQGIPAAVDWFDGTLPLLQPKAHVVDDATKVRIASIPLRCDTLWLDTDQKMLQLVWRGVLPQAVAGSHVFIESDAVFRSGLPFSGTAAAPVSPSRTQRIGGQTLGAMYLPSADAKPATPFEGLKMARASASDPIPLPVYAAIQAALWTQEQTLPELLRLRNIRQERWQAHLQQQAQAIAAEAIAGHAQIAERIRQAIAEARDAQ